MRAVVLIGEALMLLAVGFAPVAAQGAAVVPGGGALVGEDQQQPIPEPVLDDPEPIPPDPSIRAGAGAVLDPEAAAEAAEAAEAARAAERLAREKARIRSIGYRELAAAEEVLSGREAELSAARDREAAARESARQAAAAREAADAEAVAARRDLGNLARLAYASGPSELTLVASLLDSESPGDAMRRATVAQLVAEHQDDQFDDAVEVLRAAERAQAAAERAIVTAEDETAEAESRWQAASDWVAQLRLALSGGSLASRDGAQQVAQACRARPEDPRCVPSPWGEGELTRDAVWLMRTVRELWPEIEAVGGYRSTDPYPDHPMGRAVDIMVPQSGRTDAAVALGDEIALELTENAAEYGVMYVLWRQRVWVAGKDPVAPPSEWRLMGDRGGWTVNHMDHLHVSVSTGVSGSSIHDHLTAPAD